MKREWVAPVSSAGRLPQKTGREIADFIRGMPGKKLTLTIEPYQKKRSSEANRYYWGCVIPAITTMFREAGNMVDGDDVHTFLKLRVGKICQVIVTPDGEVIKSLGSTSKLSVAEFQDYLARIKSWAAEMGCAIPEPNEGIAYPMD